MWKKQNHSFIAKIKWVFKVCAKILSQNLTSSFVGKRRGCKRCGSRRLHPASFRDWNFRRKNFCDFSQRKNDERQVATRKKMTRQNKKHDFIIVNIARATAQNKIPLAIRRKKDILRHHSCFSRLYAIYTKRIPDFSHILSPRKYSLCSAGMARLSFAFWIALLCVHGCNFFCSMNFRAASYCFVSAVAKNHACIIFM